MLGGHGVIGLSLLTRFSPILYLLMRCCLTNRASLYELEADAFLTSENCYVPDSLAVVPLVEPVNAKGNTNIESGMATCQEDARSLPLPPTMRSKPCSNPDCPHPINVVTHRCGACRCTRYCSKECQITMWPTHKKGCHLLKQSKEERKRDTKAARQAAKAAIAA